METLGCEPSWLVEAFRKKQLRLPSCMTWTQTSDSAAGGSRLKCIFYLYTETSPLLGVLNSPHTLKSPAGIPSLRLNLAAV